MKTIFSKKLVKGVNHKDTDLFSISFTSGALCYTYKPETSSHEKVLISFLGQKVQLSSTRWPLEAVQAYTKAASPGPQQAIKGLLWRRGRQEEGRMQVQRAMTRKANQPTSKRQPLPNVSHTDLFSVINLTNF